MTKKILVVDDELNIRNLFKDTLNEAGYDVRSAEDGEQALKILKEESIDVIFLDLRLFGMNGIELCRKIRKTKPLSIIYAMTGWGALFEVEECREAGFDDYFTKPMEPQRIARAVEEAIAKLNRWKKRYNSLQQ